MRAFCSREEVNRMQSPKMKTCILLLVFCLVSVAAFCATPGSTRSGNWIIKRSDAPGKIDFSLTESHHGRYSSHESDWPLTSLQGLDTAKPGRQDVHFTIVRDAGKFECEGFLDDGEGAGLFHFYPDAKYPAEMQALGFGGVDEEKQFSMALQDVSLAFAGEMQNEHLQGLDTDKLIAFKIFSVDVAFIRELRATGLKASDSDKLIAFRIHGVTPEMVRFLHQAGYTPDEDALIAMRIHGVTPEWMEQLKKDGYDHVSLDSLIAFRIHGVSPEFIEKLQGLGYTHPQPDQLIAMRIHGVTPQFIAGLQSRGMQNLTIDQLVALKIHGIE
jgi:hypothetical protein